MTIVRFVCPAATFPGDERQRLIGASHGGACLAGPRSNLLPYVDMAKNEDMLSIVRVSDCNIFFELFGTKKDLFMAADDHVCARLDETYIESMGRHPADPLTGISEAYRALLDNRDDMRLQLQAHAAAVAPDIQSAVRDRERQARHEVQALTGASQAEERASLAHGLLLTIGGALDLPEYLEDAHER